MKEIIVLIGLFFCHFLADFTQMSRPYMLSAKKFGAPVTPIAAHAAVHAVLMLIFLRIMGYKGINVATVVMLQWISHTLIDVTKGKINFYFPATREATNVSHWWVFGLDQFAHAVIIIIMWNML